jgi:glycosyltransferase involved in cell wall biosynthesis
LASLFWLDVLLLRKLCRQIKPDLVHAWGNETGAGIVAQRLGLPNLLTIQGLFFWYNQQIRMGRYERFIERFERKSLLRGNVVTTESTFAVRLLKERHPNLQVIQAEHAPNHFFREVNRRPEIKPYHFIVVGGLSHRKGTDMVFAALQRLCQELPFRLTIVTGSGLPERTGPKEFWDRVQFKQLAMPAQIARELEMAAMLLMPTRVDTSPNAVKEAVVAGVPVIASRVGGIPDYVFHGKNGILFDAGDLEGFINAIRAACGHPLLGQGKVDPETFAKTRDYLSPERMAQNFLKAYHATLGRDVA